MTRVPTKRLRLLMLWVPIAVVALAVDLLMIVGGIKLAIEIVVALVPR